MQFAVPPQYQRNQDRKIPDRHPRGPKKIEDIFVETCPAKKIFNGLRRCIAPHGNDNRHTENGTPNQMLKPMTAHQRKKLRNLSRSVILKGINSDVIVQKA